MQYTEKEMKTYLEDLIKERKNDFQILSLVRDCALAGYKEKEKIKVGIVGSRSRKQEEDIKIIKDIFKSHPPETVFISGGCPQGADNIIHELCQKYGRSIIIHYPRKDTGVKGYVEATKNFYARNNKIADDCQVLYALPNRASKGGTDNTIEHAKKLNKCVILK